MAELCLREMIRCWTNGVSEKQDADSDGYGSFPKEEQVCDAVFAR
jgi:hypothetical protein